MPKGYDISEWIEVDKVHLAIPLIQGEKQERLKKDDETGADYGYSFPGLDHCKQACLKHIHQHYITSGERPSVADIGAGFGTMTWKLLSAGAKVDVFERQHASAKVLSDRVAGYPAELWDNEALDERMMVYPGDALETLSDDKFIEKYDFIWMSQVIHFLTPDEINILNQRLKFVLKPGGQVFMLSNSLNQFRNKPGFDKLETSYKNAKAEGFSCPGFIAYNAATSRDMLTGAVKYFEIASAYHQGEMARYGIPLTANGYIKGSYIGPRSIKDITLPALDTYEQTHPTFFGYDRNHFGQVVNYFEPDIAKITFRQAGMVVDSICFDIRSGKEADDDSKAEETCSVMILEKSAEEVPTHRFNEVVAFFKLTPIDRLVNAIHKLETGKLKTKIVTAQNEKDYSLLLRLSCYGQYLSVIKILLQYHAEFAVEINGQSSNGKTPLDWAYQQMNDSKVEVEIVRLLKNHGASTKSELEAYGVDQDTEIGEVDKAIQS